MMKANITRPDGNRWLIVLSCFLGLFLCISPFFQFASGVILASMAVELGWSKAQLALGPSLASLILAFIALGVGWWVDRSGSRIVALTGCIAMPLAIMTLGIIPADFRFYLFVSVLVGIAGAATLPSVYFYNLPRYFDRNLGFAISLGALGLGVGQILLPLLSGAVLAEFGWRMAWVVIGGFLLVVGVANVLLFVPRRSRVERSAERPVILEDGMDFSMVLKSPVYWLLALAFFLIAMVTNGVGLHLVGILTTKGLTHEQAVFAVSTIGIGSLIARLSSGVLIDWFGVWLPTIIFIGGQALGCFVLQLDLGPLPAIICVMMIGAGLGAESDIMPYVLRRKYGMRAFGRVNSLSFSALAMGSAIGPAAMGYGADLTGSYSTLLLVFGGSALIAAGLICFLAPPPMREVAVKSGAALV